jgi:hypothetical protein
MSFFLIVFVAPLVGGFVLGAVFAKSALRALWVVVLGFLLAAGLFLAAYLLSDTERPAGCSDCQELWGRWWEPGFAALWLVWFVGIWIAGVLAGRLVPFTRRR